MSDARITLGVVACLTGFAGCATTVGSVQEVGPGTYSIGVRHNFGGVSQETAALNEAVSKAGDYCHAKGQKLSTMLNPDSQNTVTFRCVSSDEVPPANAVNEQRAH